MGTPYSVGKGKTGKCRGKSRDVRTNSVEGEGGFYNDRKVMIQWFKRDGDKATPKNKDGLFIWYRETHTGIVTTYPCVDDAADATPTPTAVVAVAQSTNDPKKLAIAAAGNSAAADAAPTILDALTAFGTGTPAAGTIVAAVAAASAVAVT
jgi:hypothetical protein